MTLINSTVSGNSTARSNAYGGGILSEGAVSLTSSTVTDNHATHSGSIGGGIMNFAGAITISHSIVASNTVGGGMDDINPGTGMFSVNYSLIGMGVSPDAGTSGNNEVTNNPLIGPLARNGGPTETHALLAGSLAIDAGDPSIVFNPAEFDQRGTPFMRVDSNSSSIDMGAFELQLPISADFDSSGFVTGLDFLAWQLGFETPTPTAIKTDGDADNDGDVDTADLGVWESQFGQPAPAVAPTSPLVVETSLAIEPNSAFQVAVTAAITSTPEEPLVSRLPENFIIRLNDLAFRFTTPRQVPVRAKAFTEHAFTNHVDEAFKSDWHF